MRPRSRPSLLAVTTMAAVAATLVVPSAVGCSLTVVDRRECSESAQCREAFGFGSVCGDEGFCSEPMVHPRCSRTYPPDLFARPADYQDRIVLGSLFSYVDHDDTLLAAELAVRQVEDREGLEGTLFAMVHCDYTAQAGDALDDIEATREISGYLARTLGVPAIVGPRGSARAEAAFIEIRDDDVLLISPSATSPALTALDGSDPSDAQPGLLWRTAPPDSLQSEVIATDMVERGVQSPAVIFQEGAYGDGLQALFVARFVDQGGEAPELFPFSGDFSTTVADVAEGLADGSYDEVLFVSSDIADYVAFFTAATATDSLEDAYGADGVGIFLVDAAFNQTLLDETPSAARDLFAKVRGTRPAPATGALFNAFAAAYASVFNADPMSSAFNPHSYDAAWLVLYGVAWSQFNEGGISGVGIARGLRRVSNGPQVAIQPAGWATVVDAFRSRDGVDVEGASGPLDYDPDTEETTAPIELWRIDPDPEAMSGYDFVSISITEP